ncbi:MAG: enoyl-CoA hydratase [Myxococcota bacterium]
MGDVDTGMEELLCRVEDRVAVVTLNRPESRNAITLEMKEALYGLVRRLEVDDGVGCLLLTGAGEAFCAGGDTKKMARDGKPPSMEDRQRQLRWEHRIPLMLHEWPKPVVASVRGAAAGAGFSLSLCADIRIASDTAFFLTSFGKLGLSGDYGGTWFLTHLVGTAKARELYFTSDRVGAEEACRLGLVNRVVADADLDREALDLAKRIAAGPPVAFRFMKANLNRALEADLRTCLDFEADRMVRGAMTEDYQEAVRAFQAKRPPVFRGR